MSSLANRKIDTLLELTGAAADKRDLARENYRRLVAEKGESALDERIAVFEKMNERVKQWRETRSPARSAIERKEAIDFLLEASGVPQSDRELCGSKLEGLSDTELAAKVESVSAREGNFEVWRATRGSPTQAKK